MVDLLIASLVGTLVPAMEALVVVVVVGDGRFYPAILEFAVVAVEQSIVGLLVVVAVAAHLEDHANHLVWVVPTVDPGLAGSVLLLSLMLWGLGFTVTTK